MRRYFRVYKMLILLNLKTLLIYPANFYNSLIASLAWGFFSLFSIVLLTMHTKEAFGMSRTELLLLNGVYGILIGIFHVVFSMNFGRFSSVIHRGLLDSVLIKPIDAQFLLSFWMFNWVSISRVLLSLSYVIFLVRELRLSISIEHGMLFLILGACGIVLLYSLWYIVITATIWFTRLSNLAELMFNVTGVARYPKNMFSDVIGYLFLPLLLIINIPSKVLLQSLQIIDIFVLVGIASVLLIVSRKFWRYALRHYSSVSS